MPDSCFEDTRLAAVYDALDPDRSDLDAYVATVAELGARRVLDVGCGTGTLAIRLAQRGIEVTGIDPAAASIAVAERKPWADRVRWVIGDAAHLADLEREPIAEVALMTANVAQVFVSDESWATTLDAVHRLLVPDDVLVFETRVPERRAWDGWNGPGADVIVPGVGRVTDSYAVRAEHTLPGGDVLVTFSSPTTFHGDDGADDLTVDSISTLRFRTMPSLTASLAAAGFTVDEVRDAPDRPGAEWVVIARRP